MMPPPNVLMAWVVLIVGIPLNLIVTVLLWRVSHAAQDSKVLRERFFVSVAVLLVVVVFGLIFWNNDTVPPYIETDVTKLITRAALLVIALAPALYWLFLFRNIDDDS